MSLIMKERLSYYLLLYKVEAWYKFARNKRQMKRKGAKEKAPYEAFASDKLPICAFT